MNLKEDKSKSKFLKSNKEIEKNYKEHEKFIKTALCSILRKFGYVITPSEREDLIQLGLINLIELHRAFNPKLDIPFHLYAKKRINGGFIDYFRNNSTIPRRQQEMYRNYQKIKMHSASNGESISLEQVASELEINVDKLSSMLLNWEARYCSSIDDLTDGLQVDFNNPYYFLESAVNQQELLDAISNLPVREQTILSLYYDKELSLKSIAEVIGITDGRVSQLKNDAINKIKNQIR